MPSVVTWFMSANMRRAQMSALSDDLGENREYPGRVNLGHGLLQPRGGDGHRDREPAQPCGTRVADLTGDVNRRFPRVSLS